MGVERAVTRWYLQRQTLLQEIEEALRTQSAASISEVAGTSQEDPSLRLTRARERLKALGPCPKPMMG